MTRSWRLSIPLLTLALAGAARATEDPEPAAKLPPVRVRLTTLGSPTRLTVRSHGRLRAVDAATGRPLDLGDGPVTVSASGARLEIGGAFAETVRLQAESLTVEIGRLTRTYPEALLLTAARGRISLANECGLERYTEGVLACECPSSFAPEAIKAMAVAARSYSYRKVYLAQAELCDTTHCHVYRGIGAIPASIRSAVRATAGLCALYDGEVIEAVYSSDCGGYTEANEDAWNGSKPVPYLRAVEDAPEPAAEPYCSINRSHQWSLVVPFTRLRTLLGSAAGELKLDLLDTSPSGRVRRLILGPLSAVGAAVAGAVGAVTNGAAALTRLFTGEQWRKMLGASAVKSLKFDVRLAETGVELHGRGYGHGVGLCQFGANGMARQGNSFDAIVRHYYTGVSVDPAPAVEVARARMAAKRIAVGGQRQEIRPPTEPVEAQP